jgi:hypothetical protein
MLHRATVLIFSLTVLAACKPQVKSDADGQILSQKEAIERITGTPRWCGQDLDNDGSYTINQFFTGGSGQYSSYDSRAKKILFSEPMKWEVQDELLTRNILGEHPAVMYGRLRFDKDNHDVVKILSDSGVVEKLSNCDQTMVGPDEGHN